MATGEELLARYDELGWQVRRTAEEVLGEPKLAGAAEVVAGWRPAGPPGSPGPWPTRRPGPPARARPPGPRRSAAGCPSRPAR